MNRQRSITTDHKWLQLPDETVALYNAWDCVNTARLLPALEAEMRANGQWDFFWREQAPMVAVVLDLQRRGLFVDESALVEERNRLESERGEVEAWLCNYAGERHRAGSESFWLQSPAKRAVFLFDKLGLKPAPATKERPARSTSQEAFDYVYDHLRESDEDHRPVVENLFHWGKLNKLVGYTDLDIDDDGRVRPTIKLYRQRTLRLSYTNPPIHQMPKRGRWVRMRRIFCAADGCVLVGGDFAQLEARILAVLSNDQPSLDALLAGEDIHESNAFDLFGYNEGDWNALSPVQRAAARDYSKSHIYKISYGGNPESDHTKHFCPCPRCEDDAPTKLRLSRDERQAAGQRWFRRHPAVTRFRQKLVAEVKKTHWYTSPFGSRRCFMAPWDDELERELYDFPMQHGATILKNRAMLRLSAFGAPIWLDHHDQVILEVPETERALWASRLKEAMETPVEELNGYVFPAKITSGPNWAEMKPL